MISRLMQNYTSDNVTSADALSNSWNKFFIEVKKNPYQNNAVKTFKSSIGIFNNEMILVQQNYAVWYTQ